MSVTVEYPEGSKDNIDRIDGRFACRCEKQFESTTSLTRHTKRCQKLVMAMDIDVETPATSTTTSTAFNSEAGASGIIGGIL